MYILAMETTGPNASAALLRAAEPGSAPEPEIIERAVLLGQKTSYEAKNHLKNLMPLIQKLLTTCGVEKSQLTHIAVSVGPGSFTGIRIGVSTARALAQALHVTDKAVSKWERGLSYPDVTLLQPLADVFRLKVDDLLTCRSEESEVHMANNSPSPQREQANGSPAVQSVLTISAENTQRQKRRQRRIAAIAALVIALIAVLVVLQHDGALFTAQRTVSPDGSLILSVYRDRLIGGSYSVLSDTPLYIEDSRCPYCGRGSGQKRTRQPLDERIASVIGLQWSPDGRYLLIQGKARSAAPACWELWDFAPDGTDDPVRRKDISTDILVQLSGHKGETVSSPLLPALPGVSARSWVPHVALSAPQWTNGYALTMTYSYEGTDGVRRSGTLLYDAAAGSVRSVTGGA